MTAIAPDPTPGLDRIAAACREAGVAGPDASLRERLGPVVAASDFVVDTLVRWPQATATLGALIDDPRLPGARFDAPWPAVDDAHAMAALRRFRRLEGVRIVARDVLGLDDVPATLRTLTELAECCIERALAHLEAGFVARFGTPRAADGTPQRLVVIGMGKLGGGELNFSSDVDLILAFPEAGSSDGARSLDNEDWFARLGQRLAQLLGDVTADGFCHRVDLRLRPFGSTGRIALSFAAMEQYYQREGRDWERYAWIKARPVAGDRVAGARLLESLRPFVYRRYLDFNAIDGLRTMKAMIDAEVARRELEDDVKLGPGGIREVEFIVQLAQLTRGGREPALRTPSLHAALDAAVAAGHLDAALAESLHHDYDALRRVENRLQMLADRQVHRLPEDPAARERVARTLGHADWDAFAAWLGAVRARVASAFSGTLSPRRGRATGPIAPPDWARAALEGRIEPLPAPFGEAARAALATLAQALAHRALEPRTRARLERLLPALAEASLAQRDPDATLARALALIAAVCGRSTYLALLDERPQALARVIEVFSRSALLAERVIAHPLLLDDLLDARIDAAQPDADALANSARTAIATDDPDAALVALAELRQSAQFRLGLAWLARREPAPTLAGHLADVADAVLAALTRLAAREVVAAHGTIADSIEETAGFAVIGYGSLGGRELGFASDLDLVFVYDGALAARESRGRRPLDGARFMAKLAQRLVHWLGTPTRAGRLYEVDTRLRPDGSKGLLVTSFEAFAEYQRERAWVWEHQALVRAWPVAGDPALCARIRALRDAVLAAPRAADPRPEIARMRARWRAHLDRSDAARLDLKQGAGGLVDIEFIAQAGVLAPPAATATPAAGWPTETPALLAALAASGRLDPGVAARLVEAHAALLARALDATLDAAPRLVARDPELDRIAAAVHAALVATGLHRDPGPDGGDPTGPAPGG
jgi:glutamate-ammonia-ligase adenylyltransferase